jgi:hypothetical protein
MEARTFARRENPPMEPAKPAAVDPLQTRQSRDFKHAQPLVACRFDPNGKYVFAASQDNSIQRIELASGKITPLLAHQSWVRALAFVPAEKVLISGDYNGRLIWWKVDAEKPEPIRSVDAHKGWARALAVSPDGKLLASCGNDHLVKLWNTANGQLAYELTGHDCHVYNVAFHPKEPTLVSADLKGAVKQWDLKTRQPVRELDAKLLYKYDPTFRADIGGIRCIDFSADGKLLACGGISEVTNAFAGVGKPLILLFDWESGKVKQPLRPKEAFQGTAWGVAFHRDEFVIGVGGGAGGAIWFWKPDQPLAYHLVKQQANARDLALHPDGTQLAIPFYDGVLRLFDMTPAAKKP